jgi:uncharacterized protein YtpQ (UPF0354 family)
VKVSGTHSHRTGPQAWALSIVLLMAHGNASFADSLTDRVALAFNHEDSKLNATIKADNEIHLTTPNGPLTVYLDRMRQECSQRPVDCNSIVRSFVESTTSTFAQPDTLAFNAENVYPVVRPANTVNALGSAVAKLFVSRPYISGAVLLYVIDLPKAIRFVTPNDLESAGLTVDALDKLAVAHVARLRPIRIAPVPRSPGLWSAIANDSYGTSRLFDPTFWDALEARAGGPVAVALPTRDWLLAARLDDAQAIAGLRTLAARIAASEATAVTSSLVRRNGQGWSEVPP